jgi:hypothetical protein
MNSSRSDWLPTTRTGQLAMAGEWITVCTAKQTAWNIPQSDMTNLASVRDLAADDAGLGERMNER